MIEIIRVRATPEQIKQMLQELKFYIKVAVDVDVATCNTNQSNLQSRDFQTRIKCNYKYTSARINCN